MGKASIKLTRIYCLYLIVGGICLCCHLFLIVCWQTIYKWDASRSKRCSSAQLAEGKFVLCKQWSFKVEDLQSRRWNPSISSVFNNIVVIYFLSHSVFGKQMGRQ